MLHGLIGLGLLAAATFSRSDVKFINGDHYRLVRDNSRWGEWRSPSGERVRLESGNFYPPSGWETRWQVDSGPNAMRARNDNEAIRQFGLRPWG